MSFFGKFGKGPNINNTSKAALADHVSQLSNACAHIDGEWLTNVHWDSSYSVFTIQEKFPLESDKKIPKTTWYDKE